MGKKEKGKAENGERKKEGRTKRRGKGRNGVKEKWSSDEAFDRAEIKTPVSQSTGIF